ncbi:1743_t:CDS:2, partial [Ambispora leptoticha]
RVQRAAQQTFYSHGKFCATHQVTLIVSTIFMVLPLFYPAFETYYLNAGKAYGQSYFWESPSSRSPLSEESFIEKCGTRPSLRVAEIVINATGTHHKHRIGQGEGVLDKSLLLWTWHLQDRIAKTEIHYPTSTAPLNPLSNTPLSINPTYKYTLSDFCFKPFPNKPCLIHSPLEFWENSLERLKSDSAIINTLSKPNPKSSFNIPIPIETVFGNPVYSQNGRIIGADSIRLTYFLEDMGDCAEGVTTEIWELLWQKVMKDDISHVAGTNFNEVKTATIGELKHLYFDFKKNHFETSAEYILLALGYLVGFLYISFSLGRLNLVKSKFGLGFSAVAQVIASLVISLSICSLFGVKLTLIPFWEILPFMMMIIGVENYFVLTNAVTSTSMELAVKERVAIGLGKVGYAITKYLGWELLILLICSATSIDSVQEFCVFTLVAVIVDYILQMTFFITTLSIDIRRLELSDLYRRPMLTNINSKGKVAKPDVVWNSVTPGRVASFLAILIAMIGIRGFYPSAPHLQNSKLITNLGPDTVNLVNNTFWEADTAVTADAFWDIVNPTRVPRYLEIQAPKIVTLMRDLPSNDGGSTPVNKVKRSPFSFTSLKRYIAITIKTVVWFIKFIFAPAVAIGLGIAFLLHFLMSPDRKKSRLKQIEMMNSIIWLPKKSVDSSEKSGCYLPRVLTLLGRHTADVDLLCANSNGMIISTAIDKHITSWDGREGVPLKKLERYMRRCASCKCGITGGKKSCISWPVRAMCMSEKIELAAAGFEDGVVRVWDIKTGQASHILKDTVDDVESVMSAVIGNSPSARVTCLKLVVPSMPKSKMSSKLRSQPAMLISAYRDGYIREWDLISGKIVHTIATNQKAGISCLCVVDDEDQDYMKKDLRMYSGAKDGSVRCWVRKIVDNDKESFKKDHMNETEEKEKPKSRWKPVYTIVGQVGNVITNIAYKVIKTKKNWYGIVVTGAADGEVRVYDYLTGSYITSLSHEAITNIIIHPLEQQSCPCGSVETGGGFWVVTSSLDEKVHFWQLVRNVMDCSCMALHMTMTLAEKGHGNNMVSKGLSTFDSRIIELHYDPPHQYHTINEHSNRDVFERDELVSYRIKFIGRVSQSGASAIVFLRENIVGVRQVRKASTSSSKISNSQRNRNNGTEDEWEAWLFNLNDPKAYDSVHDNKDDDLDNDHLFDLDEAVKELSVRTIPLKYEDELNEENDLILQEQLRNKNIRRSKYLAQRQMDSHNWNVKLAPTLTPPSSSPAPPTPTIPLSHFHEHNDHDHSNDEDHHHHEEDEEHSQVVGQVIDYRQRNLKRPTPQITRR